MFNVVFRWTMRVEGAENTLYEGQEFLLRLQFQSSYPFKAPDVNN